MEKSQKSFYYVVRSLEMTDSTNNYLRNLPLAGNTDFLYGKGQFQTAGKGQGDNHWESERGKNLIFSVKCKPWKIRANEQFILLQTVSVAVCRVIGRHLNDCEECKIKWPNDIYYRDSKLSGTLSECSLKQGWVNEFIAGVGINVNQIIFLSDAPNPISMAAIEGHTFDCDTLIDEIAKELSVWFQYITTENHEPIRKEYEKHLYRSSGTYKYSDKNGEFEAILEDILPNGHLRLRRTDGTLSEYEFKEVKYLFG